MPKQISDDVVYRATLEVVISNGYAKATTKRIAEAADINEVTLFRKYGSKRELVRAAIEHGAFSLTDEELQPSGDIEADLVRIADAYVTGSQMHSRLFPLLMSEMIRHPELHEAIAGPHAVIGQLAQLFAHYQSSGIIADDEEPFATVACFLGPLIVVAMLREASPQYAPRIEVEGHVRHFIRGRRR